MMGRLTAATVTTVLWTSPVREPEETHRIRAQPRCDPARGGRKRSDLREDAALLTHQCPAGAR